MISVEAVPDTLRVMVSVEGSETTMVAEVISPPPTKLMLGVEAVLNSKPAGAFRMRVWPLPEAMSIFLDSSSVMGPRVVQAPEPPLAAVSAEIAEPPDALVTLRAARAAGDTSRRRAASNANRGGRKNFANRARGGRGGAWLERLGSWSGKLA